MEDEALCPDKKPASQQRALTMKRLKDLEEKGYNVEYKW